MGRFTLSMSLLKRHQRASFERKVEQQLPALFRIARGIVGNQVDAEDLVHDTCVKALAFESIESDNDIKLKAWLKKILVNTYRDQYRRRLRSPVDPNDYHATTEGSLNVFELVASTELSPVESIQNRDSSSAIQHAFSALPPEVRVVSVLFLVNDLSYRDIAATTDCPIGTVMSRLAHGRRLLMNNEQRRHHHAARAPITTASRGTPCHPAAIRRQR